MSDLLRGAKEEAKAQLRGAKEEAKSHINNDRLGMFQKRAGKMAGAFFGAMFNEVEDPTPRPSKHYFFPEGMDKPQDPKPPAQDEDISVTNLIPSQGYHTLSQGLKDSLFEDRHFNKALNKSGIEWRRPHQISKDPEFIVGERDIGVNRFDVNQGELGNCWFLSALANLAENEKCFDRVVPHGQDFKKNYKGIFRFRFFRLNICHICFQFYVCFDRFNSWVEVVVDDLLPTRNGKLIFLRSRETNEFWGPLLEKAYAKLYGSYKVIY